MRGSLDVESDSVIFFKKIMINEVSSHFRNGALLLVVQPSLTFIKPFIIEDFVIKARKMHISKPIKRRKLIKIRDL